MLELAILEPFTKQILYQPRRISKLDFTTSEHGFEDLTCDISMPSDMALSYYQRGELLHVDVVDNEGKVWEGRIEDTRLSDIGISIQAFGYWRALSDFPITATWENKRASDIVQELLDIVSATNPSQLSRSGGAIIASNYLIPYESATDEFPASICSKLQLLAGPATQPWLAGVWEGQLLRFEPRGTTSQTWHIQANKLDIVRSVNRLFNSAYVVFQDANGDRQTTSIATDQNSINERGILRRTALSMQTTSLVNAQIRRDAYLSDSSKLTPQSSIPVKRIFTKDGTEMPLWKCRAGDLALIGDLPVLSEEIVKVAAVRVGRTEYNAHNNTLIIEPETPLSTLDYLIAQQKANIQEFSQQVRYVPPKPNIIGWIEKDPVTVQLKGLDLYIRWEAPTAGQEPERYELIIWASDDADNKQTIDIKVSQNFYVYDATDMAGKTLSIQIKAINDHRQISELTPIVEIEIPALAELSAIAAYTMINTLELFAVVVALAGPSRQ